MRTSELIALLSRQAGPAPRALVARRIAAAGAFGVLASGALALLFLGLVPRDYFGNAAWWLKLCYALALALCAAWLVARLARPAASSGAPALAALAVLVGMGVLGVWHWQASPLEERLVDFLGHSWKTCPRNVLALSLPALAAAFWALRGLAPTRPRLAGGAAGLFAGALGALGYALGCTEVAPSFVATWYTLGVAFSTLLGFLLGPSLLRW